MNRTGLRRIIVMLSALTMVSAPALAQVELVRGDFRNAIAGLNKLSEALKAAQREQKTADKEVQAARQTLEKLQSVRI